MAGSIRAGLLILAMAGAFAMADADAASASQHEAPRWLDTDGSYRLRYESLDQPFRRGASGSDQIVAQRLLVALTGGVRWFRAGVELEDSRAFLDDSGTPIGTDDVNTFEPLQAFVGGSWSNLVQPGDSLDVRVGRFTMAVGGRRLVARNGFRNTINAFTGVRADWRGDLGVEAYVLGRHRRLLGDSYTPGVRLHRSPAAGAWDFEVELALQLGDSRDLTSPRRSLDRRAGFVHLDVARTFQAPWAPRLVAQLDLASGDDPDDHEDNGFDTLFGARRFEFGPTGIYGALARSNLISPGLRLEAVPSSHTTAVVGYRLAFLASRRYGLATALLRDPEGESGRFVGQQLELGLRYDAMDANLQLDVGGAYLIQERFLEQAPGAPNQGDTIYGYLQATLAF